MAEEESDLEMMVDLVSKFDFKNPEYVSQLYWDTEKTQNLLSKLTLSNQRIGVRIILSISKKNTKIAPSCRNDD